ncbi:hypothetical protein TTHERM_00448640 (macronuclear) [Tetrahymena thermophila SB210]|uniref:Transmembrane protein n=1 Tax=Tetrahymena thermophila (strain SB210) TaxID=312017 RepID=Q239F0_TETTS|nr:hypothetical protein TTHERM_00448640 [Tetrahymena thermophila SB210]EAR93020.2 hypothetical protein TTHERM_00448640 [Tetrahymena thermophila SB210]|eukprot:XP_001013265.2 hypothetical protein TTHERM_00448640 [Tetrahymena thermophila SB210]
MKKKLIFYNCLFVLLKLFAAKLVDNHDDNLKMMCEEGSQKSQCQQIKKVVLSQEGIVDAEVESDSCVHYKFSFSQTKIENLAQKHYFYFEEVQKSSQLYFQNNERKNQDSKQCFKRRGNNKNNVKVNAVFNIKVLDSMPVFQDFYEDENEVQMFNLNVFHDQIQLSKALIFFENKSVEYKLRQLFFMPNYVELHPQIQQLLATEKQVLSIFQQKKDNGDCILYLQYNDDQFDYFFLPITEDFHFDYAEAKAQEDLSQLNPLQQAIKKSQKALLLGLPNNIMKINNQHCAIHSFGLITSFKPMVTYAHQGYVICAQTIFDALFGLEDPSQSFNLQAYSYEDILTLSEQQNNLEVNNQKKFTYASVIQVKQITAYMSVILQDQIGAQIRGAQTKFKRHNQDKNEELHIPDSQHQYSLFKIVSAFDQNTRLYVIKIQTFEEILEENFSHNANILEQTLEFVNQIEEHSLEEEFPLEYKSFKKVMDQKHNFVQIEKQTNIFVIAFDKINKFWYGILKFIITLF